MAEPTQKLSISLPRSVAEAAKARSGPKGLSAYVADALIRQIERDNLRELVEAMEAQNGPASQIVVEAFRADVRAARAGKRAKRELGAE